MWPDEGENSKGRLQAAKQHAEQVLSLPLSHCSSYGAGPRGVAGRGHFGCAESPAPAAFHSPGHPASLGSLVTKWSL